MGGCGTTDMRPASPRVAVAVFLEAYLVVTARDLRFLPLGREAGALVGALLLVAVQAMTPEHR